MVDSTLGASDDQIVTFLEKNALTTQNLVLRQNIKHLVALARDEVRWEMSSDEEYAGYAAALFDAMRILAFVWRHQPDYQERWREGLE